LLKKNKEKSGLSQSFISSIYCQALSEWLIMSQIHKIFFFSNLSSNYEQVIKNILTLFLLLFVHLLKSRTTQKHNLIGHTFGDMIFELNTSHFQLTTFKFNVFLIKVDYLTSLCCFTFLSQV